ncbi:MAG: hypothetical protein PHU80_02910 [Kiritimatiellae bacterium]|nr:hypothetical protein [Kiritimatiellia bacterium]
MRTYFLVIMSVCAAGVWHGAAGVTGDAGIDWRFYEVFMDNPVTYQNNRTADTATDTQRGTYYSYSRLRTRPWGRLDFGDQYGLYLRLANEFRFYDNNKQLYPFPNELFIDNLYLDFKGLLGDRLNLRVGRQDLYYGGGRVIRDGTPGDVTRSFFFDAVKASVSLTEKSSVDIVGMWQRPDDPWTLGNEETDLTRYHSRQGGNDLTERGLMAYYSNRERQDFPFELYYVYKDESRWLASSGARLPERRYHTVGMRMKPRFSESWSAEAELAGQYGRIGASGASDERDILAMMAYGGVTYTETRHRWQPYVTTASLVLSGDDERFDDSGARGTDTGWNPVFGRMIWYSDLMTVAYPFYRLSNLAFPHVEAGIRPSEGHWFYLQGGPHFACVSDNSNGSTFRGWLGLLRYQFPLLRPSETRRGAAHGVLKAEVMQAGDYYGEPDIAYYIRFELHARY